MANEITWYLAKLQHDDVMTWNIIAWLVFCEGNPKVTGERASNAGFAVLFDIILNKLSYKQSICRWFEISWSSSDVIEVKGWYICPLFFTKGHHRFSEPIPRIDDDDVLRKLMPCCARTSVQTVGKSISNDCPQRLWVDSSQLGNTIVMVTAETSATWNSILLSNGVE